MIPFTDIVPVVFIPIEIAGKNSLRFHFLYEGNRCFFCRKKPTQKCATIAGRVRNMTKRNLWNLRNESLEQGMILLLYLEDPIDFSYLSKTYSSMKLADPVVVADEGMQISTPVGTALMIVAMIGISVTFGVNVF